MLRRYAWLSLPLFWLAPVAPSAVASPQHVTALALREDSSERMRLQPPQCHERPVPGGIYVWTGRYCVNALRHRAFYDECELERTEGRGKGQRKTVHGPNQQCPVATRCAPAQDADGWPRIFCATTVEYSYLLMLEEQFKGAQRAAGVPVHEPWMDRYRRYRRPAPWTGQALDRVPIALPDTALPVHLQAYTFDPPWVAEAALPVSAMQPSTSTAPGDPSASSSNSPRAATGLQHYTASMPIDLDWPAGVSLSAQALVIEPADDAGADEERPRQRQRLDTEAQITVTRNDDPLPLCTTATEGGICEPANTEPLQPHDVLHIDLLTETALNAVLQFLAADVGVFEPKGH